MLPEKGLVRRSAFKNEVSWATNTLARKIASGEFPAPHKGASSGRLYYWNAEEIWQWIRGTWKPANKPLQPELIEPK